jgi:hypothetical protein
LTAFMTVSTYVAHVLLQTLIVDCFIQLDVIAVLYLFSL